MVAVTILVILNLIALLCLSYLLGKRDGFMEFERLLTKKAAEIKNNLRK